MVKPLKPWLVRKDAKLAVHSWQPIKITTSEESLINTLLNLQEGKVCNRKSNSGHKIFGEGGRKKKVFRIYFPPCCVKKRARAGRRVLRPSPVQRPSPVPGIPQGFKQGVALIPTQLRASLDLPRGKIELMQTSWEEKAAGGLWEGTMSRQHHPGSSELGGLLDVLQGGRRKGMGISALKGREFLR